MLRPRQRAMLHDRAHDVVPDGGWGMIALLLVVVGLYLGVSVSLPVTRPHTRARART